MELYETEFGICDHVHTKDPLALVSFQPSEKFHEHSLYRSYLEAYVDGEIHTKLGLNFDEFLNRPKYQIEAMLKVVNTHAERKAKANKQALDEIEKQNREATSKLQDAVK